MVNCSRMLSVLVSVGNYFRLNMGTDKLAKKIASIDVEILKSSYDKNLVILCFDRLLCGEF